MSQIAGATSAAFSQDQFLQLLVTQLQNQDPLAPVSDREFINQLTQLNTLQSLQSLEASFAQNLRLQQLTQGADLVGREIDFTPAGGGTPARGTVDAVAVQNGQFVLRVGAATVPLDNIVSVR
jgi:flagellar basal-body rod modification protein FlgD